MQLNLKLLEKLNVENLERVKLEAELNLDDLSNSEDIVTNKSNTLFQVLIVIFTTVAGYLISSFDFKSILSHLSILFIVVNGYVLYLLLKIIYPNKIALKGAAPSNLIHQSIFTKKSDKSQTRMILLSRIYSIDIAIKSNKENLEKRVRLFDKANRYILFSFIVMITYLLLLLIYRVFLSFCSFDISVIVAIWCRIFRIS